MNQPSADAGQRVLIEIEGMHCAGCVSRVEQALDAIPDVNQVHVNLAFGQAAVTCRSSAASENLVPAIEQLGFQAQLAAPIESAAERMAERAAADQRAWWRRFVLAAVLLAAILSVRSLLGLPEAVRLWLPFGLATILQGMVGGPYFVGAWKLAKQGTSSMDTLVALGTGAAYVAGVWGTFTGQSVMTFADAGMILTFISLGKYLETRAKGRASMAIRHLLELTVPVATVVRENGAQTVPVAEVAPGETIIVAPGEKVPLDAEVSSGQSEVDQAWLTGESLPVGKMVGDEIYAGTINGSGAIRACVTRKASQTALAQVVELVQRAQESKADVQRLADRVVSWFVPAVLLIATGTLLVWGLVGHDWHMATTSCVAVLVIACPCALGLATPMAVIVASGRGAEHGILIKDATALETAGRADVVLLDKTGTITEGRPRVTEIRPAKGIASEQLLSVAAAVEGLSKHPLAKAVCEAAKRKGAPGAQAEHLAVVPGRGIQAESKGQCVLIGNLQLLADNGISVDEKVLLDCESDQSYLLVAVDGTFWGAILVEDPETPESRQAVADLKKLDLRTVVLSGDRQAVVESVAARIGIDDATGDLRPEEKHKVVERLRSQGHIVAMIGDGINDAPALASADLGIAIGTGADVAIETAHIVLVRHDLGSAVQAIRLARNAARTIRQNLAWAFLYNILLLPLAAGVLYPLTGLHIPPAIAAAAMAASSVTVVANSLRLRVKRIVREDAI